MFARLGQIHRELGVSILLIEQNATQALEVIEKAVLLTNGRVAFAGSKADFLEGHDLRQAYLGV
jgi:branched-chain amino acid transport system ATP-binding protein